MTIHDLVKKYELKILDFKNVYELKMTIDDVQRYVRNYHEQLKLFKVLTNQERKEIIEYAVKAINDIIDYKKNLGFTQSGKAELLFHLIKSELIDEISIDKTKDDLKLIIESLFQKDPWEQTQPKNDDEYIIHEKWWIDIQLWKNIEAFENYFLQLSESADKTVTQSGRPYDDTAPQREIEKAVLEILKDESFIGENGAKPSKIREYLLDPFNPRFDTVIFSKDKKEQHAKAIGKLKNTAVYERVKMALENCR